MMLESGRWLGKGSLLSAGRSLGRPVECDVTLQREEGAATLSGSWREDSRTPTEFSARVAQNEEGTWTVAVLAGALRLQGSAKLDSPPNLALLWNDAGSVHMTLALFAVSGGFGCRGFVRDGERVDTWEIAFRLQQEVVRGPNVVSLHRRR